MTTRKDTRPIASQRTLREEAFCRLVAIDRMPVYKAFSAAGYKLNKGFSNAYRLGARPAIAKRIRELREEQRAAIIDASTISVSLLTAKMLKVAENIYPLTEKPMIAAAAANAYRGLLMDAAKLNGMVIEKTHTTVERKDVMQFSDEELVAILRERVGEPLTIEHEDHKTNGSNGHG